MKAALILLILAACSAAPVEPSQPSSKAGWQHTPIQNPGHRMHAERETI